MYHIVRARLLFRVIFTVRSLLFMSSRCRSRCWGLLIGFGWGYYSSCLRDNAIVIGVFDLVFGIVSVQYAAVESHWSGSELLAFHQATGGVQRRCKLSLILRRLLLVLVVSILLRLRNSSQRLSIICCIIVANLLTHIILTLIGTNWLIIWLFSSDLSFASLLLRCLVLFVVIGKFCVSHLVLRFLLLIS